MDIPQFPKAFTSINGLGAPKRYFPIKNLNRVSRLVASIMFFCGSVLVFLYGAYKAYGAYQKHGPALIGDELSWPAITAFILFLLGVMACWSAYVNWKKGAGLFEEGFAVRDRKGIRPWRWEEVTSLTTAVTRHYSSGLYTGTTHVYTLYNRQNKRIVLSDIYVKVEELAGAIEEYIYPLLYSRAVDQHNTGKILVFGPVAVSKTGIQIDKKTYPWREIKEISIHQGTLKVSKKDGGWFSGANAAAASIPNLRVLLAIIYQVVGIKPN